MICARGSHLGLEGGGKGAESAGVTVFQESAEVIANVECFSIFQNIKVIHYVGHQNRRLYISFLQSTTFWQERAGRGST